MPRNEVMTMTGTVGVWVASSSMRSPAATVPVIATAAAMPDVEDGLYPRLVSSGFSRMIGLFEDCFGGETFGGGRAKDGTAAKRPWNYTIT